MFERGVLDRFDRANLSDIFEYMSQENATRLFETLADHANPGGRFAYWNMMVPRRGSEYLPKRLEFLPELSRELFLADKTFFYRDFVVDRVRE